MHLSESLLRYKFGMTCLNFLLVIGCFAKFVKGQDDVDSMAKAGRHFFQSLQSPNIKAEITDKDGKRIEGMDYFVHHFPENGIRVTSETLELSAKDSVEKQLRKSDWLLRNDGKWLCALSRKKLETPESNWELSFLTGGFDWKSRKSAPLPRSMAPLMTNIWLENRVLSLVDPQFWSMLEIDESKDCLEYNSESRVKILFRFGEEEFGQALKCLEVSFLEAIGKNTKDGMISESYDFVYRSGRLTEYKYKYKYRHNSLEFDELVSVRLTLEEKEKQDEWSFANTQVPERTSLTILEDRWSKYVYSNGDYIKLVDENAVGEIEGLYFQSTEKQRDFPSLEFKLPTGANVKCSLSPYMSERQSLPHCGIYSLAAAGAANGKLFSLAEMFSDEKLMSGFGSSASSLIDFARKKGLNADLYQGLGSSALREFDCPVLLHLHGSAKAEGVDHWILFLGFEKDGTCRVMDLPRASDFVTLAELQSYWDGTAIPVSKLPIIRPKSHYLTFGVIFLFAVAICWTASLFTKGFSSECITLILFSLAFTVAIQLWNPTSCNCETEVSQLT